MIYYLGGVMANDGQRGKRVTACRDAARRAPVLWWALRDSNPQPRDYAYHFGFRRRTRSGERVVCGLDYAFTMPTWVSAKVGDYSLYTFGPPEEGVPLGSALGD